MGHNISRKISLVIVGNILLLFVLWIPATLAHSTQPGETFDAHQGAAIVADTPTPDPTLTTLTKEQLQQQVQLLQFQNEHDLFTWFWGSSGAIITALVTLLAAYLAFLQWQRGQRLARDKDRDDQKQAHDKDLQDRQAERAKETEERFQKIVEGLGNDKDTIRIGAAVMLQRFVQPGYDDADPAENEVFHRQAFELTVAYLRLLPPIEDLTQPPPSLNQALIAILRDVFPILRSELQKMYKLKPTEHLKPEILFQMLDAGYVRLDLAYLYQRHLEQIWMPGASLRGAFLQEAMMTGANMKKANLSQANLSGADLRNADLSEADLTNAQLMNADLTGATLTGAILKKTVSKLATFNEVSLESAATPQTDTGVDLSGAILTDVDLTCANLTGANLSLTYPEKARSLKDTIMIGVIGLTDAQREACSKMGARFA